MDKSEYLFSDSIESSLISMESEYMCNADEETISDFELTELYEYSDSEQ